MTTDHTPFREATDGDELRGLYEDQCRWDKEVRAYANY